MAEHAEVLFAGGAVLTQDPAMPVAEALALRGERVQAVGSRAELEGLAGPRTRRVDLAGGALLPGFVDAHTHTWKIGQLLTEVVDLRGVRSLPELLEKLRARAATLPEGAWLEARGYNEAIMAEGRGPDADEVEAAAPGRPAFLTRTCGHIGVANRSALRLAGVGPGTAEPRGGAILRGPDGTPTGELHETAMGLVRRHRPPPTPARYRAMLLAAARHHLARGITGATDPGVAPELLEVYRELDAAGELPCRAHPMAVRTPLDAAEPLGLPARHLSPRLRIDTVKLFADGGLSGATAALSESYRGLDHAGLLRLDAAELMALARGAHEAGLRVAIHAIGDVAIDAALDCIEALQADGRVPGHRIEHFGLPDAAQIARAARLRVVVAPQPIFLDELGANFRRYLPEGFLPRTYPLRAMVEAGLVVALSSDAPVVHDDGPLRGVQAAMLRGPVGGEPLAPEQALTLEQGLAGFTREAARATGDHDRGVLAPGAHADLAWLDRDPRAVPPPELAGVRVRQTWVAGSLAYEA